MSDRLDDRQEIYEQQILWDKEELDRKIKQLKGQVSNSQTANTRLEINKLLQQQTLVQQYPENFWSAIIAILIFLTICCRATATLLTNSSFLNNNVEIIKLIE